VGKQDRTRTSTDDRKVRRPENAASPDAHRVQAQRSAKKTGARQYRTAGIIRRKFAAPPHGGWKWKSRPVAPIDPPGPKKKQASDAYQRSKLRGGDQKQWGMVRWFSHRCEVPPTKDHNTERGGNDVDTQNTVKS